MTSAAARLRRAATLLSVLVATPAYARDWTVAFSDGLGFGLIHPDGSIERVGQSDNDLAALGTDRFGYVIGDYFDASLQILGYVDQPSTSFYCVTPTLPQNEYPEDLIFDAAGRLLFALRDADQIVECDLTTHETHVVTEGGFLTFPEGIAEESTGSLLVANGPVLYRVNRANGAQTPVGAILTSDCDDIALEPGGATLIAVGDDATNMVRFNIATGATTIVREGKYESVAVAPDGTIVATPCIDNHCDPIVTVDPTTGVETPLASEQPVYAEGIDVALYAPEPGPASCLAAIAALALLVVARPDAERGQ